MKKWFCMLVMTIATLCVLYVTGPGSNYRKPDINTACGAGSTPPVTTGVLPGNAPQLPVIIHIDM